MKKEALCRPDEEHWCIECCPQDCPLLGEVEEGKLGCLVHWQREEKFEGLKQREICQNLDCLTDFEEIDKETIRQAIIKLPGGQFKMSEVLSQFEILIRTCAWCGKFLGKKLGGQGTTHGMCQSCFQREIKIKRLI